MSGPDITVTLNRSRSRSHAGTTPSSNNSASTSLSEGDSSGDGVQVSPSESQNYSDQEFSDIGEDYDLIGFPKHEVGPSESVSRSSTSDHHQLAEASLRHRSRREPSRIRVAHRPSRLHRSHHPSSPESVGSHEELYPAYGGPDPPRPRPRSYYNWAPQAGGQSHQYAPGYTSQGYNSYTPPNAISQGQQLVPFNGATSQYPYSPYQQGASSNQPGYFPIGQHGLAPPTGMQMASHGATPYAGAELMPPPNVPSYFPFHGPGFHVSHPVAPSPVHYPHMYPSPPAHQTPPPPPQPQQQEPSKPDGYEELKQMLLDQKAEQEARELAARKAEEDRAALAEAEKKKADEIAAAAAEAAAKATTEAEKKAADKAAEEAAKAAEEAAKAKADADAAIAAAAVPPPPPPPPEEKKKPIKFKDAVGRKFSFPFHLCATWEGMEDLIKQAFLHVDIIGPHVAEGHYDLIGPNNEIILPAVWETVIEPDWTITMHMWPMPEPKPEEEVPIVDVPPPPEAPPEEPKKKGKKKGGKPVPGMSWFAGSRPKAKTTKPPKKA
ncbi:MAG: hypothetical protein MMC23_009941 [Stictis urceolatum]|nr:hypothetical protein [Stictis urceolata]